MGALSEPTEAGPLAGGPVDVVGTPPYGSEGNRSEVAAVAGAVAIVAQNEAVVIGDRHLAEIGGGLAIRRCQKDEVFAIAVGFAGEFTRYDLAVDLQFGRSAGGRIKRFQRQFFAVDAQSA